VLVYGSLVQCKKEIYPVLVHRYLPVCGTDHRKGMSTPYERGVVVILVYIIAKMVEHLSDERTCITNTVSRFPANEYRYFFHSISPAVSDTCGNGIYVGIPGTGFGSQMPQAGRYIGETGEQ